MDRQDIDALLVGALYGELTPADEARLTAHLESHPGDRGALDDLKSARAKVRESRIFELQAEPPQHISALLLQEAHRRAPKNLMVANAGEQKDGWFWRFARSFMLHPAMAAAAMLVVVLGVGAVIYNNKGADFAKREAPASMQDNQAAPQVAAPAAETVAAGSAAPLESYHAGLADDLTGADQGLAEGAANEKKQDESAATRWRTDSNADPARKAPSKNKGIAVTTEQLQPKDFESDRGESRNSVALESKLAKESAERQKAAAPPKTGGYAKSDTSLLYDLDGASDDAYGRARTGAGGNSNGMVVGGATAPGAAAPTTAPTAPKGNVAAGPVTTTTPSPANRPMAQPPPPAPPSADKSTTTATATVKPEPAKPTAPATKQEAKPDTKTASGSTTTDTKKVATQKPAEKAPAPAQTATPPPDPLIAWAKGQHATAVKLAKDGKCGPAAQVALAVSQKTPSYYASYMATDRQLKSCKQYIDDARDREAEKSAKSRAQKRVNADEAQHAPPAESAK